jgi:hypothetical protein
MPLTPTDIFSHCAEVKMLVRTVRNVLFLLQKNLGHWCRKLNFAGHWDIGF